MKPAESLEALRQRVEYESKSAMMMLDPPGPRANQLRIDTNAQLCERIDEVLARSDIAGFDCLMARSIFTDPEARSRAQGYAMRGVRVSMTAIDESSGSHVPTRVIVTPPLKVKA